MHMSIFDALPTKFILVAVVMWVFFSFKALQEDFYFTGVHVIGKFSSTAEGHSGGTQAEGCGSKSLQALGLRTGTSTE